jgi:hypothetical protein
MTDNLIEFYEKSLDEANNPNTTSKNARGGNGENIYRKNSSNSGKGKTATTIGAHGGSKLSRKQRKALNQEKQQEQPNQEEQPKEETQPTTEEQPKEDKKSENETDNENKLSDADITDETRQDSATEIVSKRVNFFNKTLASLYRIAGNLVAHKEVFPIFVAKEIQPTKSEAPTQNASYIQNDYAAEMFKHIKLFEDEEKTEQTPGNPNKNKPATNADDKINLRVAFATKMSSNKFTSNLNALAKAFQIDGFDSLTNIGKFCAVVGGLVGKYRELAENIAKVNKYIKVDEIELDGESINMNINNVQLKQLFPYFRNTPAELVLRVLNAFCAKNITSITANTNLNKLIKALPNEINADYAKKFSTNPFTLSFPRKLYADKNFPKSWFIVGKSETRTLINKEEKEGANPSETGNSDENPKK